eukprot:jgi/Bigna1/85155/estExt_fgenesh1_pg.C_20319
MRLHTLLRGRSFAVAGFRSQANNCQRLLRRTLRRLKSTTSAPSGVVEEQIMQPVRTNANLHMARWLYGCCGMVFGMVALGGITRLTGSGLSMVEWKPTGILPPTTKASCLEGWEEEFNKYKSFPEYQKHNDELSLAEFKWIWFMEWGHRMAGRATGMVFGIPLLYFGMRGMIPKRLAPRMAGLLLLGGSQGLIGWWMVRSGLNDKERFGGEGRVSPYRLAAHLSMAFILYTALFNTAIGLSTAHKVANMSPSARLYAQALIEKVPASLRIGSVGLASLVGLTAFSGAFVAGNHAGMVYDEFPTMGGKLLPDDIVNPFLEPKWRNIFEHDTMVQVPGIAAATATLKCSCGLALDDGNVYRTGISWDQHVASTRSSSTCVSSSVSVASAARTAATATSGRTSAALLLAAGGASTAATKFFGESDPDVQSANDDEKELERS